MINYDLLQEWFDLRSSEVLKIKESGVLESFGATTELIKESLKYNPSKYEIENFGYDTIQDIIDFILTLVMQLLVKDAINLLNPELDMSIHGGYDEEDGYWLECTDIDWEEQSVLKKDFEDTLDSIISNKFDNYWVL